MLDKTTPVKFDRMKRVGVHRGLHHYWGFLVRSQHAKTKGRRNYSFSPWVLFYLISCAPQEIAPKR